MSKPKKLKFNDVADPILERTPKGPAEKLADYLFENGFHEKAIVMFLVDSGGQYIGGWNKEAVVKAIKSFFPDQEPPT